MKALRVKKKEAKTNQIFNFSLLGHREQGSIFRRPHAFGLFGEVLVR